MRRFGEIHENHEVERNLTYTNQRNDTSNNVPSNAELRAAVADYFRRLAEANEKKEVIVKWEKGNMDLKCLKRATINI